MGWFNEEEVALVDNMLGLSERATVGTCLLSAAAATPIYLSYTLAPGAMSLFSLLLQSFLIPLVAGLALVASGEGGFARWMDAARDKPSVMMIVALPALALFALAPLL